MVAERLHAIGYVRVSTQDQVDGISLEVQRTALENECERRGWTLDLIQDGGYSAKNLKRPGIQRALGLLAAGERHALVVPALDRLSRSLVDFASLMATAREQKWSLVCLDCPIDTTTPAGEAMAGVLATFAQFERRMISQRTREALAAKKAAGVVLGRPRVMSAELVSRICAERAAGCGLQEIADRLNAEQVPTVHGGERWWASTVRAVAHPCAMSTSA